MREKGREGERRDNTENLNIITIMFKSHKQK